MADERDRRVGWTAAEGGQDLVHATVSQRRLDRGLDALEGLSGDIGRRPGGPVREVPDLLGHHGEPAPGVAGAGRLDRRVQR